MNLVRFLHALIVAAALLLGQITFCQGIYVRADGTVCPTCPITAPPSTDHQGYGVSKDCRDCCVFTVCDSHQVQVAVVTLAGMDQDLARGWVAPASIPEPPPATAVSKLVKSFFPNAPPGESCDRAPPFRVM